MIKHSGVISKINNEKLTVDIEVVSACAGCHAKGICTSLDKKTKQIEITNSDTSFQIGDKVFVFMEEKLGTRAIFIGYFLPFVFLVAALIVLVNILQSEGLAGLISLGILVPYYLMLFIFRKKIEKKFFFTVGKAE